MKGLSKGRYNETFAGEDDRYSVYSIVLQYITVLSPDY